MYALEELEKLIKPIEDVLEHAKSRANIPTTESDSKFLNTYVEYLLADVAAMCMQKKSLKPSRKVLYAMITTLATQLVLRDCYLNYIVDTKKGA